MSRWKTFVNGGSFLPTDADALEDDLECAFGTYKQLADRSVNIAGGATAGTYMLTPSGIPQAGVITGAPGLIWLDPARYWTDAYTSNVNPRSVYYSLAAGLVSGTPAVGTVTFTAGLYAVTGEAAGAVTFAGTPISGSTVTVSNPAAATVLPAGYSGDFAAPAAGWYGIGVAVSATLAASSLVQVLASLSYRQV